MSRLENENLYVPLGGGPEKNAVELFVEKHRLPPLKDMLYAVAAALGLFVFAVIILLLTGLRFVKTDNEKSTDYRYFGWIYGGVPAAGFLHGTDGTVATVSGERVRYSDGSVYRGKLSGFMKQGNGVLVLRDGSVYSGGFENDRFSGYGEFRRTDGSGYSGTYLEGKYSGEGTLIFPGGDSYTGSFADGEMSGAGRFAYSNGDSFTGSFEHDMRTSGVYLWADGGSIEGKFDNNLPVTNEKIIYTDVSGDTYKAYFIDGALSGKSVYTKPEEPDTPDNPATEPSG